MGRAPCCSKVGLHRGPWTAREDALLTNYIQCHGEGNWRSLPKKAGLLRCGKSCRLRWMNYLRPDIKRGNIGPDEEDLIIRLHSLLGNRWSLIAGRLPGRTDNEIKNYWNSHLSKKLRRQGIEVREGSPKALSKRSKTFQKKNGNRNHEKRKKKKTEVEEDGEAPRTQIHTPKPTRFTPTLRNYNALETSQGSDQRIGSTPSDEDKGDISWSDVNMEAGLSIDCDFHYEDRLLEGLYQEYSQLLNSEDDQVPLVSFTESLLV